MELESIATAFVITAPAGCAQEQQSTPAKPTKEDAQKVFKAISSDKAKLQTFCDIAKLGDEMEKANEKRDSKKFEELSLKEDELVKKLGTEYATLMDGIQNVDPQSE